MNDTPDARRRAFLQSVRDIRLSQPPSILPPDAKAHVFTDAGARLFEMLGIKPTHDHRKDRKQ